jgi:hypothetical protein
MSDAPLLVDPPSQRLSGTHPTSESTKASASPNIPPGVSGSNSTDPATRRVFTLDIIAVCNAPRCGREFPINSKSDDLPYHHAPGARGSLKAVCHGSGRRATVFAEA